MCQISSLTAAAEDPVAEFSSFANFEERKRKSNLLMSFPKIVHQKGSFGQIRKNPLFRFCRSILDIFRLTLLNDLPDLPCRPEFAERKVTNKTTPVSKINCAKQCIQRKLEGRNVKTGRVLCYSSCNEPSNTEIYKRKLMIFFNEKLRTKTIEANQLSDQVKNLQL